MIRYYDKSNVREKECNLVYSVRGYIPPWGRGMHGSRARADDIIATASKQRLREMEFISLSSS